MASLLQGYPPFLSSQIKFDSPLGTQVIEVILRHYPSLGVQTASPFPPAWGKLRFDSSVEQIFPGGVYGGNLVYDNQTHIYTLTRQIQQGLRPPVVFAGLEWDGGCILP
jgi:hypothetical protein